MIQARDYQIIDYGYQRNGPGGEGFVNGTFKHQGDVFYLAAFLTDEDGVEIIDSSRIVVHRIGETIDSLNNAWRGDYFEPVAQQMRDMMDERWYVELGYRRGAYLMGAGA